MLVTSGVCSVLLGMLEMLEVEIYPCRLFFIPHLVEWTCARKAFPGPIPDELQLLLENLPNQLPSKPADDEPDATRCFLLCVVDWFPT